MLAALVPALAAAFLTHPHWQDEPAAGDAIALADALAKVPPVLWVDARPAADYLKAHIPGELPLNEDEWSRLLPGVLNQWTPRQTIVVYCNSAGCDASGHVARRLHDAGLSPVHTLHGGWEAWAKH